MPNFSDEGPLIYRQCQEDLQALADRIGVDLTVYNEIILTEQAAMQVRKDIDRQDFDLVLLFHPTYIAGDLVFELLKTEVPVGLWAIEEPARDGPLPLASLVCLNQNISIAHHCFSDRGRRVKWFFGDVSSKTFKPRFEITAKALCAVRELRDAKVAQIGKIADGFRNMYYDERAIYQTLGVDVVRGIEIEDVLAEAAKVDKALVEAEAKRIYTGCSAIRVDDAKITDSVRIYLAVAALCREHDFKALAFSCWPKLGALKNMTACLSDALLDSIGIPAACEGDLLSAISMLVLTTLSGEPTAVMDLPAFDPEDDSLLLWHCGSAPFEMANEMGVACRHHYRSEFADEPDFEKLGPIMDLVYRSGDVTVFRLTGESDRFYYFTGHVMDTDKPSWYGSRGWVNGLKLYGESVSALDLMNTLFVNGAQHHYPMVLQDVSPYLEEFAYWLGLERIPRTDYQDYLIA
jgi:L-fucose isomerase-like protein